MSEVNYKEIIKQEYIKCATDPVYFMKKYCYIQHPQRGRLLFNLYPFQDKVLKYWKENKYNIVLKSRQLGISTLAAGYALWLMIFHKDKNVICIATKQETAKNMVVKTKFMFDELPSWLKIGLVDKNGEPFENNKLNLKFYNGSQIKASSAASDAGRSEAVSLLIIDEAAFIDNIEMIWASAWNTVSTGGQALLLSTPNGTGNWFHRMWSKATLKENEFLPIKLPWTVHPERDEKWRKEQDDILGERLAAQECDCDFSTSGDTVFHSDLLKFYENTFIKEPSEKRGINKDLWVWDPVDYMKNYMIVADVARGDGKDYSAFHVIDIEDNIQVAEYKGHLPPKEFAKLLNSISTEYNNGLLIVESNNIGWSVLEQLIEMNYDNLYYSPKGGDIHMTAESYGNKYNNPEALTPGFYMSLKNRVLVIGKFEEFIREKSVTIRSRRLLEEMKTFIWKGGRQEAQNGCNDDLVIPFATGMYLRDTSFRFKKENQELQQAALHNMKKTGYTGVYTNSNNRNPYLMNIRGMSHDFSWLINKKQNG